MGFSAGSKGDKLMEQLAKDIGNSHSARVIIPVMHNYLEHVLERLILEKTGSPEIFYPKNYSPSFLIKTQILYVLKILDTSQFQELQIINTIRNKFIHQFEPDPQNIRDLGLKLKFHKFNEKRSPIEMVSTSCIELMSQLTEKLE